MKVFLRKDIENVGLSGEIIKVGDGYARNFLIPNGFAFEVTAQNEAFYLKKLKHVDNRQQVIATKTSMMAEKIKGIKLIIKRKMHDDGKLYGGVNATEIVALLEQQGIHIDKNKIKFDKIIKSRGQYIVTIALTKHIQSQLALDVIPE